MGKVYENIDAALAEWIHAQKLFFVATAPRAETGHVNCSPKGGGTLRVISPHEVAFLDGVGSGIETIAHVRDNGRIVIMLCAFDGSPRIIRLHGHAAVVDPTHAEFKTLLAVFPHWPSARAILRVNVSSVSDSCGYGVPLMDFRAERTESANYVAKASDAVLVNYMLGKNQQSLDGLPALAPAEIAGTVIQRQNH